MIAGGKQIFLVNDAHNIVYAFMVDRQTGKTLFGKNGGGLVHGSGVFKGDYIHSGGENVLCVQVVKADSRADKLALFPVQTSLALGLRHKGEKLFIRDAVVLLFMEQPVQQLFPLGKEKIHRCEQRQQNPENRRGKAGERLGRLFGKALRGDLPKN